MEATVSFSDRGAASFDAKATVAATFLKITALGCAIVTLVLAALVLSLQAGAWILTGERSAFPISKALALAGLDQPPASVQGIFGRLLDLPASGFLLAVAAILIGFLVFAASIEKQFSATKR